MSYSIACREQTPSARIFRGVPGSSWLAAASSCRPPGLGSGLGCLQSCIVPWEPLEHFAGLILPVHYLAVIPAEDISGGRQGARLAGRTPTPPPSRELGGGQGLGSLQCDRCDYEG